jgi:hypothetical protein
MDNIEELAKMDPIVRTDQAPPSWAGKNHTVQGTEDLKDAEAQDTGFGTAVKTSFLYGGNYGYSIAKDIMRKGENGGVDPTWDDNQRNRFIEQNKDKIAGPNQWRYELTGNSLEASALLKDEQDTAVAQNMLERRGGFSTFAATMAAGLIDVDAPLSLATGGITRLGRLGLSATKLGRMGGMAIEGGIGTMGAAAAGYYSSPGDDDWTSIPLAGLQGAAMGVGMGLLHGEAKPRALKGIADDDVSVPANLQRERVLSEFGESVAEGSVLAKKDIRNEAHISSDSWGFEERARAREAADGVGESLTGDVLPEGPSAAGGASEATGAGPKVFRLSDVAPQGELPSGWEIRDGSVGAAQQPSSGPGINAVQSGASKDIIRKSRDWARDSGVPDEWYNNDSRFSEIKADGVLSPDTQLATVKAAKRFHDIVTASPLVSDFGRLMRSGSTVAQKTAFDLFENASGIIRNNRSGAMLMDHYEKNLRSYMIPLSNAFTEWAVKEKKAGVWDRHMDASIRREFNEKVAEELQSRAYDGPNRQSTAHPAVQKAADAIDQWSAKEIEIGQGRAGEHSIKGFEDLKPQSGYLPQKWDPRKIADIIAKRGANGRDHVIAAIQEAYTQMHPTVAAKDLKVWATATVDRAQRSSEGVSTNLIGILQADGRTALEDALRRNGMPDHEITRMIDGLTGSMEERQKAGHTKSRIDVDMRYQSANGIRIMDLMDTDLDRIIAQRSRQTGGAAALARKGIRSRAEWNEIKQAILDEQATNGQSVKSGSNLKDQIGDLIDSDKHVDAEMLDHLYSYFGSGPIAGGVSPYVARMKKVTNLSLLNQLGLAQLMEFGTTIATVGVKRFFELLPDAINAELRNKESVLVKELRHMNVFVPEERVFRDDLTFEHEKYNGSAGELGQKFDNLLNKAQRLQGYTSGFYKMRNIQQRIATTSAADRIMRDLKYGGKNGTITWERLRDAGFDGDLLTRVHQYVSDGTVKFKDRGLHKLNLDRWDPRDAEDFILTLNRQTNILVQKAMSGESSYLFHKDGLASLFLHLKAFPMLAMEKQAYRSLRLWDHESGMSFMYGLGTAAAAYTIKQTINDKPENLTAKQIAMGALNGSNLTAWIPMWTDPIAGALGMDSLRFNHYATARGQAPVFTDAASYETLNRLITLPGAIQHSLRGDMSTSDVRAMQSIPLVGNAYGFTALFNNLKEHAKEVQKENRKQAKVQAKEDEAQQKAVGSPPGVGQAAWDILGLK